MLAVVLAIFLSLGAATYVLASATTNFTLTVSAGTLAVDMVDGSYVTVASPTIALTGVNFSFGCQTTTGTFGSASQQMYVANPDAADNGWVVSLAGSATTAVWDSSGTDFDFNDSSGSGCTDGADAGDTVGGQMTVNPSVGTLAVGQCDSCVTTNVTKGSSNAYVEGTTNSITVLTGAASSNDVGDWTLQGVSISQTVPGEQPVASDYDINMVLSIVAS